MHVTKGIPVVFFFNLFTLFLQEHLEQLVRDNEQLKAEVKELLNSSALEVESRNQGRCLFTSILLKNEFKYIPKNNEMF